MFVYRENDGNEYLDEFGFPIARTPNNVYPPVNTNDGYGQNDVDYDADHRYAQSLVLDEMGERPRRAQSPTRPAPAYVDNGAARGRQGSQGRPTREERINSLVNHPSIARQLRKKKKHKPWFIWTVSLVQLALLFYSFALNSQLTGNAIEPLSLNPMVCYYYC